MKTLILKTLKVIVPFVIVLFVLLNLNMKLESKIETKINSNIIGTWILEKDTTVKYVFTNEYTCNKYFSGELVETDSVICSNTSPQCGITVPTGYPYMQLINKANPNRHYCYEILTLTSNYFGIRPVDLSSPPSYFNKM